MRLWKRTDFLDLDADFERDVAGWEAERGFASRLDGYRDNGNAMACKVCSVLTPCPVGDISLGAVLVSWEVWSVFEPDRPRLPDTIVP